MSREQEKKETWEALTYYDKPENVSWGIRKTHDIGAFYCPYVPDVNQVKTREQEKKETWEALTRTPDIPGIEKTHVTAKSRRLNAKWTIEIAQEVKSTYGLDVEEEIMNALSQEISKTLDAEIARIIKENKK